MSQKRKYLEIDTATASLIDNKEYKELLLGHVVYLQGVLNKESLKDILPARSVKQIHAKITDCSERIVILTNRIAKHG